MVNINVKWGKEKLSVDVDMNEPPLLLKSQLFALTGVAPDRQKVVIKGRTLGDESWNGIALAEGALVMMMGSSTAIPEKPGSAAKDTAAEGGADGEKKPAKLPIGLRNVGNTCYLNSVIQSLKTVPVLKTALRQWSPPPSQPAGPDVKIAQSMKNVIEELDRPSRVAEDAIIPFGILQSLHAVLPQFASRSPQGQLQQQDANECFAELQRLTLDGLSRAAAQGSTKVSEYFRGRYAVTLKNLESEEEALSHTTEDFFQLSCFLSVDVKYIQTGIKEKLTEEIEKMSQSLQRNCKYEKKAMIDRLPSYLSVQMVRFFYKSSAAVNAKILKDIKFPLTLDLFDVCTPALQERLRPQRDAFKEMEDARLERLRAAKLDGRDAKEVDEEIEKAEAEQPFSFEDDPGSNNSGFYDLQAVITHKGRSSDSGHYVAWVRLKGDQWAMCDDDEVHPVNSEQILKLSGGGDWHCAYVLLYGPRRLYKVEKKIEETPAVAPATTAENVPMEN